MSEIERLGVDAHIHDLRRDAERAAAGAAAARARRRTRTVPDLPFTIRRAKESDEAALRQLAALDSRPVPAGPVLLAESNGELRAALSLTDGETVADPFHPTAAIVELLVAFAAPGRDGRTAPARRRRHSIGRLIVRSRHNQASAVRT